MGTRPRALLVARDPGAANALAPVARTGPVSLVSCGDAGTVFAWEGAAHVTIEDTDQGRVDAIVREIRPEVLLTGTSLRVERDRSWWSAAERLGIPSMALLDHWTQYRERFSVDRPFDRLPDRIAVMDERARREIVALGCPSERVVVTGHPGFDALLAGGLAGRAAARARWRRGDGDRVVAFALEPLAKDYGERAAFDERGVARLIWQAAHGLGLSVVVRPHPRQDPQEIEPLLRGATVPALVESELAPHAVMAGADAVIGMGSMFLLEAALSGLPVLSVQPIPFVPLPRIARDFPSVMTEAADAAAIRAWLVSDAMRGRSPEEVRRARNSDLGFAGDATSRVWAELGSMAAAARRDARPTRSSPLP